jgi:TRAP-type C4-dicarboxylate transport system permease small subunit
VIADFGERPAEGRESLDTRLIRYLGSLELIVTLVAFCGVVALVGVQVTLRFLFHYGLVWAQEVSQLLMLVAYFLGTSYVYKARHYLVIGFLLDRFAEPSKIVFYLATQALTAAFCAMLFLELCWLAPRQLRMETYILQIPRFYSSLPLLVASASMALTAVYYGVRVGLVAAREHDAAALSLARIETELNPFRGHRQGYL